MNRTRDMQRHHRERVIAKRVERLTWWGHSPDWVDHPGRYDKKRTDGLFRSCENARKNYVVPGFCRRDLWDNVPDTNVRARLKRDTQRQVEELL